MVNESNASPFCIVGSGYRKHIPKPVKTSFFRRLRSWPILSMAVLMIIVPVFLLRNSPTVIRKAFIMMP